MIRNMSGLRKLILLKGIAAGGAEREHTVTGDVVSFMTNMTKPLKVDVALSPIQNLNGYDYPWAGGAGVNLAEGLTIDYIKTTHTSGTWSGDVYTVNGVTFTCEFDNNGIVTKVKTSGTATGTAAFVPWKCSLSNGTEYKITGCPSGGSSSKYELGIIKTSVLIRDYGNGATYTPSADDTFFLQVIIRNGQNSTGLEFAPLLTLSSVTDRTWYPWENICPITGHTGANVWDDPAYGGTIDWNQIVPTANKTASHTSTSDENYYYILSNLSVSVPANHVTLVSAKISRTISTNNHIQISLRSNSSVYVALIALNGEADGYHSKITKNENSITITQVQANNYSGKRGFNAGDSVSYDDLVLFDLTEMFGSTVADYIYSLEQANAGEGVAYFRNLFPQYYYAYNAGEETCVSAVNGNPYTHKSITFPDPPGTVYGGELSILQDGTGVLKVETVFHEFDGTESESVVIRIATNYVRLDYSVFGAEINPTRTTYIRNIDNIRSNMFNLLTVGAWNSIEDNRRFGCIQGVPWFGNIGGFTQASEVITWFGQMKTAGTPLQLCYELAEPTSITLTAEQVGQILALNGINNVWADAGPVTVTYKKKG